jgi:nucleotide-binding universal stress UspA family protein
LKYAGIFAEKCGAELHVLHVVVEPLPLPAPDGAWIRPDDAIPELLKRAQQDLAANTERIQRTSIPLTCAVEVGYPVEQLLKYIDDHQIDLVVLGTQGYRGLSRLLLGSIAEKVVRLAKCPVLTVHPPVQA